MRSSARFRRNHALRHIHSAVSPRWRGARRRLGIGVRRRRCRSARPFCAALDARGPRSRCLEWYRSGVARRCQHCDRHRGWRPNNPGRALPGSLPGRTAASHTVRGPTHHGERRRESSIDGVRNRGAGHDSIDGVLVVEPRDRRCILDGIARRIQSGVDGRQRSAVQPRTPQGVGQYARDLPRSLPTVLAGPERDDLGRGRRRARSRRARDRTSTGRPYPRRDHKVSACPRTRATLPSHRSVGRAGPFRVRFPTHR